MDWKAGDWVVFELSVGQIKEIRENGSAEFSDGTFATSGMLTDRFRPLTLKNKAIVETFDAYYNRMREIDGEAGFNYPDIFRHFADLALSAIDADEADARKFYELAQQFAVDARNYPAVIQGVRLFRRNFARR